ncbi:MAG: hypothetical protein LUQ50_03960 [Methanospirillum sp.]|uniref:hypothetical protein n=1 Tax=Methanospirillum sp. TaxID=45200 RepID=UPI00236B017C|nr:hypothetical protein [Methanospirillum sp.]MDD1728210.1 hypothetical protein [Methanospirillum sp.]
MRLIPVYHTIRTAEYAARESIESRGFHVARITERQSGRRIPFQLIAWNGEGRLIFIKLRSFRGRNTPQAIHDEIRNLTLIRRTGEYPGEIQYWIFENLYWKRYQIYVGGALCIREECDATF